MLSVTNKPRMLGIITLNVVMLSVVAPFNVNVIFYSVSQSKPGISVCSTTNQLKHFFQNGFEHPYLMSLGRWEVIGLLRYHFHKMKGCSISPRIKQYHNRILTIHRQRSAIFCCDYTQYNQCNSVITHCNQCNSSTNNTFPSISKLVKLELYYDGESIVSRTHLSGVLHSDKMKLYKLGVSHRCLSNLLQC